MTGRPLPAPAESGSSTFGTSCFADAPEAGAYVNGALSSGTAP
ncbi:hypothetical protein ACFZAT_22750 [Streptomyces sp. NPDC008163]